MKISDNQIKRVTEDLMKIANTNSKEVGEVEFYDSAFWFFGSELAVLRLDNKFRYNKRASSGFSKNLNTHYFKLETPLYKD